MQKRLVAAAALLLMLVSLSAAAHAQDGYPAYTDLYVNDFAQLMNPQEAANVRSMFTDLQATHGVEATVVTIDSIHDYGTGDTTIRQFATNLFNTWGVGNAVENNGVLILVAVTDRETWIALGSGYDAAMDDVMQEVVDEHMLPYFRRGEYSRGIYRGARAVVGQLTSVWPDDRDTVTTGSGSTTTTGPVYTTTTDDDDNDGGGVSPWIIGGGALGGAGAGAYGVKQALRYRPRKCERCGARMTRLDEAGDDVYLDSGQQLEEMLSSVDYDIWKCPECNHHELYRYPALLSRFQRCPQCGYRTVNVSSTTLEAATTHSTGRKRVTKDCNQCDFHHEEIVIIPRVTKSSSGGGSSRSGGGGRSSFGGGRSSGGGAGGKW